MPTNYPSGLDTFTDAATLAAGTLGSDGHSTLHANKGDAIEAIEAKVGIDSSAVTTSLDYRVGQLELGGGGSGGPPTGAAGGVLGGTYPNPTMAQFAGPVITVASNDSGTATKAGADYVCDGTDDHAQIASALSICNLPVGGQSPGGGWVQLTGGRFNVNASQISVPAHTTLAGVGASAGNGLGATRLINQGSTSGPIVQILGTNSTTRIGGSRILDLCIDGGSQTVDGILIKYANAWEVNGVGIFACTTHGAHLYGGSDSTFRNSRIDWCGSNSNTGVNTNPTAALLIEDDDGAWANDNVVFRDVFFENNPDKAIDVVLGFGSNGPYEITFDRCKVENHNGRTGAADYIYFGATNHCRVVNCYFFQGVDAGIEHPRTQFMRVDNCTSMWVENNNFSGNWTGTDPITYWLTVNGGSGIWVKDNTFQHGGPDVPTACINWTSSPNHVYGGTTLATAGAQTPSYTSGNNSPRGNYIQNTTTTLETGTINTSM